MLPYRIYNACCEGNVKLVIDWFEQHDDSTTYRSRSTTLQSNDDDYEKCKWFPIFDLNASVDHGIFVAPHILPCMYLFGLHGHQHAIDTFLAQRLEKFGFEQYMIRNKNPYSWLIQGAAEAGNISLLNHLCSLNIPKFQKDILLGACRGNRSEVISQFVPNRINDVHSMNLFGICPEGVKLFEQHAKLTQNPFVYSCMTKNYHQANMDLEMMHNSQKHEIIETTMLKATQFGDIDMMENLLSMLDVNGRVHTLKRCIVHALIIGQKNVIDWALPFIPQAMKFSSNACCEGIKFGFTPLLVQANRNHKIELPSIYVSTYLNHGGRVNDQDRHKIDKTRRKKQQYVSTCFEYTQCDKRMVDHIILRAIPFRN